MALFRSLNIALLALALLAPGSHGLALEEEVAVLSKNSQESAESLENLADAPWLEAVKQNRLVKAFLKQSFPFVDFVGWLVHMDDQEFAEVKEKVKDVEDKTRQIQKIVKTAKDFMDPKRVRRLGPLAAGIHRMLLKDGKEPEHTAEEMKTIRKQQAEQAKAEALQQKATAKQQRLAERQKKAEARQHLVELREANKQTPEDLEREAETRESVRHDIRLLVSKIASMVHLGKVSGILSLPLETEFVPIIMSARRHRGKKNRHLVDLIANVSFDSVLGSNITGRAFMGKLEEVAEVMTATGNTRPAELINMTKQVGKPLLDLAKDVPQVFSRKSVIETGRLVRLIQKFVALPQLQGYDNIQRTGATLARLLEAGANRRKPAKDLAKELGVEDVSEVVPLTADFIFMLTDIKKEHMPQRIYEDLVGMMESYVPGDSAKHNMKMSLGFLRDVVQMLVNNDDIFTSTSKLVGGLANSLDLLPPELLEQAVMGMRWVLVFACNMNHMAEKKSFCKDYVGGDAAVKFERAMNEGVSYVSMKPKRSPHNLRMASAPESSARESSMPHLRLRGQGAKQLAYRVKAGAAAALPDSAVLVQRAVAVRSAVPFPAERMASWAEDNFFEEYMMVKRALKVVNTLQWVFKKEHRQYYKTLVNVIKMVKQGQKQLDQFSASMMKAEAKPKAKPMADVAKDVKSEIVDKDEARRQRKIANLNAREKAYQDRVAKRNAARASGPAKQTQEEREREKVTRTTITSGFDDVMEKYLALPSIVRKPIEAIVVPEIMQFRRKTGHNGRSLIDNVSSMALPNFSSPELARELAAKAMEVMEAVRIAGYEGAARKVDLMKKQTTAFSNIAADLKKGGTVINSTGSLGMNLTSRLLHATVSMELNRTMSHALKKLVGIMDSYTTEHGTSGNLSGLIVDMNKTDAVGAQLMTDVVRMLRMTVLLTSEPGRYLKKYTRRTSLRALMYRLAKISNGVAAWPVLSLNERTAKFYQRSGSLLKMLADYREGHEDAFARKLARILPLSDNIATSLSSVLDQLMSFACRLDGVLENVHGCEEFIDRAPAATAEPMVPLGQAAA